MIDKDAVKYNRKKSGISIAKNQIWVQQVGKKSDLVRWEIEKILKNQIAISFNDKAPASKRDSWRNQSHIPQVFWRFKYFLKALRDKAFRDSQSI